MTITEKYRNEGWVDGKEEGLDEGVSAGTSKMLELIKSGLSPDEAFRRINEERTTLVTSLVKSHA